MLDKDNKYIEETVNLRTLFASDTKLRTLFDELGFGYLKDKVDDGTLDNIVYSDIHHFKIESVPIKNGDAIIGNKMRITIKMNDKEHDDIVLEELIGLSDMRKIDSIYQGVLHQKYLKERSELENKPH